MDECEYFSLKLEEPTDGSGTVQLAVMMRMVFSDISLKELCKSEQEVKIFIVFFRNYSTEITFTQVISNNYW